MQKAIYRRLPCFNGLCDGIMTYDRKRERYVCDRCLAKAWPENLVDPELDQEMEELYADREGYSFAYDPEGNHLHCPMCCGPILYVEKYDRMMCSVCCHAITEAEYNSMLLEWDLRNNGFDGSD